MKHFLRLTLTILLSLCFTLPAEQVYAKKGKILFIPHDTRPISCQQTAEVVEQLGYDVRIPPKEYFGDLNSFGNPEKLCDWLEDNASSAKAAVIASDSILYGGLIPSRKHEIPQEVLDQRMEQFKAVCQKYPKLKIYVFASLMRTPSEGIDGFTEEPDYYVHYGHKIYHLTALDDKSEIKGLSSEEKKTFEMLQKEIPEEYQHDWFSRREKNLNATKQIMDLLHQDQIDYLVVGRDDNSPLSQTHKENRELLSYAEQYHFPETKFQSLAGIDEFGLLLLTRAVNDLRKESPRVNITYNQGTGGDTVPAYSDDPIQTSLEHEISIIGGHLVSQPKFADFVLMINTDPNGDTFHLHNSLPGMVEPPDPKQMEKNAKYFSNLVREYIDADYPVGIADINYANGADNDLMNELYRLGLLFKLQSYAGWNTATNSSGFALGTGVLSTHMKNKSKDKLLYRRYLDDWAYQANVRTSLCGQLHNTREGDIRYYSLNSKKKEIEERITTLMHDFASHYLPPSKYLKKFYVTCPWDRMFECEIHFDKK